MIGPEQWAQIQAEANDCPVIREYFEYVRSGHMSREGAVVALAITLSRGRRELIAAQQRTLASMLANETSHGVPPAMRLSGSPELDR